MKLRLANNILKKVFKLLVFIRDWLYIAEHLNQQYFIHLETSPCWEMLTFDLCVGRMLYRSTSAVELIFIVCTTFLIAINTFKLNTMLRFSTNCLITYRTSFIARLQYIYLYSFIHMMPLVF